MSKTLYLVRHGRQDYRFEPDGWLNPLKDFGIERSMKIAAILKEKNILPDKIISSYAFRALNTAVIFAKQLHYPLEKIEITDQTYHLPVENILQLLQKQNNRYSSVMLFGHNPYFTDLFNFLTGENIKNLTTSSVAAIHLGINDWKNITSGCGKKIFIEIGKE